MWESLLVTLSSLQRSTVVSLAAELRAGGVATAAFAFFLGAVHALTPGHGKAALTAYFLGQESRLVTGLRVALAAAFLHVLMGLAAFTVLRFVVGQLPSMTARGLPLFAVTGYGLILLAGLLMIWQSVRPSGAGSHPHMLTAGVGLLPCPLTITVLGFAWAQSAAAMIVLVLISLAGELPLRSAWWRCSPLWGANSSAGRLPDGCRSSSALRGGCRAGPASSS